MDVYALLRVAVGGALGAILRFVLLQIYPTQLGQIPWTTFGINMIGCFAAGLLFPWIHQQWAQVGIQWIFVGFLGGFTTFSAFGLENARLIEHGAFMNMMLYALLSAAVGVMAGWIGLKTGSIFVS